MLWLKMEILRLPLSFPLSMKPGHVSFFNGITPNLRRVGIQFVQLTTEQQQTLRLHLVQLCHSSAAQ